MSMFEFCYEDSYKSPVSSKKSDIYRYSQGEIKLLRRLESEMPILLKKNGVCFCPSCNGVVLRCEPFFDKKLNVCWECSDKLFNTALSASNVFHIEQTACLQ